MGAAELHSLGLSAPYKAVTADALAIIACLHKQQTRSNTTVQLESSLRHLTNQSPEFSLCWLCFGLHQHLALCEPQLLSRCVCLLFAAEHRRFSCFINENCEAVNSSDTRGQFESTDCWSSSSVFLQVFVLFCPHLWQTTKPETRLHG